MVYPAYLLCLMLLLPAFGLTALVATMVSMSDGFFKGLWKVIELFAFFGAGIAEPLQYGWRIVALLAVLGFILSAGAVPQWRIGAFYGLGVVGTLCIAYCLFASTRQGRDETTTALIVLSPSFLGVAASVWFATKFE